MTKTKMMLTGDLPSFINGALVAPNTPVAVPDTIDLDDTAYDENGNVVKGKKRDVGLRELGEYTQPVPVVMGAINPTGPSPTKPQQLAPGDIQTPDGYASSDGAKILAEGSVEALEVEEGGEPATRRPRRSKTEEALS